MNLRNRRKAPPGPRRQLKRKWRELNDRRDVKPLIAKLIRKRNVCEEAGENNPMMANRRPPQWVFMYIIYLG